ncbi:diguanylate cyclase (GGDEF)-like protein [Herbihabitans rhizosphaerae]|uniref:Diguanylate cyclase (GGDEF)-like protein n=1 Tax=Herbihabitans rhizosphaerae TaxID=1872711 RepID=A0A4Q7KVR6_9PSEU|nr:diguanylate cyclase [Herbihabitans rhizosphaerae]RZS40737.1 diguanylate cyclase (GGDEF)-like protein [Herbihabitans rhizosphaerae]
MLHAAADGAQHDGAHQHHVTCTACGQPMGYRTRDKLTGLLDRWSWDEAASDVLDKTADQPSVLLLLDLDRFKQINDVHGHLVGDDVLRAVAAVIRDVVRQVDVVGRYGGHGGDEFLLLLPATDRTRGEKVAHRILACAQAAAVSTRSVDGRPLVVEGLSASVGGAVRPPGRTDDLVQLVREADGALMHAKRTGRSRVAFAMPDNGVIHLNRRASTAVAPEPVTSTAINPGDDRYLVHARDLVKILRGAWVPEVLAALSQGPLPYTDLLNTLRWATVHDGGGDAEITDSALRQVLRDMRFDELIASDDSEYPYLGVYHLTPTAVRLADALVPAVEWAADRAESIASVQDRRSS